MATLPTEDTAVGAPKYPAPASPMFSREVVPSRAAAKTMPSPPPPRSRSRKPPVTHKRRHGRLAVPPSLRGKK